MTPDEWADIDRILLAVLDLGGAEREAYIRSACAGRDDLAAEVRSLLAEEGRRGPLDSIGAAPDLDDGLSLAGRRMGSYRLIREIGCGGMGSVWLAERDDDQFRKEVAIKFLAPGLPVAEALRRFREERQILASLEHPHIARLLDAGRSDEGFHYIVMEYVAGVPITAHCAARHLSTRERVELLRKICSTVHFAHQRLVVHRDLKPANILVTAGGEPKLLDFGIAKVLTASGSDPLSRTAPLLHPFTPAYSSPEQLRGAPATTSSDVYSLGVLCYELLSGVSPHRIVNGSTEDIVRSVCEEDPVKPSVAAARQLDDSGDLDAIILKALRKAPDERYASAEDLAADLGRHLDGLPVHAHRGTLRYQAQKFAARHRVGVAAAIAAIVAVSIGVSAVMWQARVARRERAVAERRFEDVRQLARALMFDLYDRIAQLPGSTGAREALVTEALRYLNRLAQEAAPDLDLALEVAAAYGRVAEVQGDPGFANLGDTAGAMTSYNHALAILGEQITLYPEDARVQLLLARTHEKRGDLLLVLRRDDEARAGFEAALRLRESLAGRRGTDADRKDLAGVYFRLANLLENSDAEASLQRRRRALEIFEALLTAQPDNLEALRNVALTCKTIGSTLIDLKREAEATPDLLKALALDERRVRADPTSALARLDLSFDLSLLAVAAHNVGNLPEALGYWRRVIEIRRALADADPKDVRARSRLAYAHLRSGSTRMKLFDHREALTELNAALQLSEALLARNPQDNVSRSYFAEASANIGYTELALATSGQTAVAARASHRRRACDAFARALDAYTENIARKTASPTDIDDVGDVRKQHAACAQR